MSERRKGGKEERRKDGKTGRRRGAESGLEEAGLEQKILPLVEHRTCLLHKDQHHDVAECPVGDEIRYDGR